jgi:hypothetical protein
VVVVGVDRRAGDAQPQVEEEAREPADTPERRADEHDREGLARDRHGREREPDRDLRGGRDQPGAAEHQDGIGEQSLAWNQRRRCGVRAHGTILSC